MAESEGRKAQEMILSPNEFAFVRDDTKGEVNLHLGPMKTSLGTGDSPVIFDEQTKRFRDVDLPLAKQTMKIAPEGFYITLKNPTRDPKLQVTEGKSGKQSTPLLDVGKKIHIPGPASIAVFPGQMAKVRRGHTLRSNEYLLVRVYDGEAAKNNWRSGVVVTKTHTEPVAGADPDSTSSVMRQADTQGKTQPPAAVKSAEDIVDPNQLVTGQLLIIKGTEVSFYIPPTGVEVIAENPGDSEPRYVRKAVTLERLEYCLLLDQSGDKRYEKGPNVVFPRPTEEFREMATKGDPEKAKAKKFRAVELTPTSGIYLKVIADYKDEETGDEFKEGEELFITGKQQMIYYPRDEHAILKYGEQEIHYGIAIPEGEGRYVLNRQTGVVRIEKGPTVFLPDPRKEVIVQRALSPKLCALMYPGNTEALQHNLKLLGEDNQDIYGAGGGEHILERSLMNSSPQYGAVAAVASPDADKRVGIRGASKAFAGDAIDRKNKFTPPRSLVLNTRFDGVVSMKIFNGFAVNLVSKNGDSRVVQGPKSVMLEYDEEPQVLRMSRGKPKGSVNPPLEDVYLHTNNNRIGDQLEVETADYVKCVVKLSYRLNFTGDDPEKWFDVDNYVKLLCDNMRSKIRNAVRQVSIRTFYASSESTLRDIVLGTSQGSQGRPGTTYEENGLQVYDVEILDVMIADADVRTELVRAQREAITQDLKLSNDKRRLDFVKQAEEINQQIEAATFQTETKKLEIKEMRIARTLEVDKSELAANAERDKEKQAIALVAEKSVSALEAERGARARATRQSKLEMDTQEQELKVTFIKEETSAVKERFSAIQPGLIESLNNVASVGMAKDIVPHIAPMKMLGIDSLEGGAMKAFSSLLAGTALGARIKDMVGTSENGNGTAKSASLSRT